jgi:type I restriction enzyme S subunit
MSQGWVKKRLSEVTIKIGSGATPRGGDESYKAEGISLIRSLNVYDDGFREAKLARIDKDQANALSNVIVEPQDVLLNITGASVARCCRAPAEFLPARVNQHVSIIRPAKEKLDSDFLHYLLISEDYKNRLLSTGEEGGSTRQAITKAQLQDFVVEFPESLPEQQRIVALLDDALAGLATAKANAEQNLQNARALFESHLQSVFSQRGEGWVETTLDKISTNLDSRRVPITKNVRSSGEYPYYGASGIVDYVADYIFEGENLLISEDGANLLARSTPIAFSASGRYWVNNHAHILHFESMATQRFVEFYLESIKLDEFITGAAQPKLNQRALNAIPIPIPESVEEQAKIVNGVESLQEETQRLTRLYERKLAALEELKKSLLHQAFNGEL